MKINRKKVMFVMGFFRVIAISLPIAFAISGCNTVDGFGKDVKKVGDEIEEAAD